MQFSRYQKLSNATISGFLILVFFFSHFTFSTRIAVLEMASLLCVFKFQLIEYGAQGNDPPSKSQITGNAVSILNNSGTPSSFKTSSAPSTNSSNASPSAKMGTPTRVKRFSRIDIFLR